MEGGRDGGGGETTTTINITGWKVERCRTDDDNDGNDDDDDDKDNNNVSFSPTFNLLEQLTTSKHGAKPWSKPIVCPELT
jgi:hypothetical protein